MKRLEQFRQRRQEIYGSLFSARVLFITGLIIMVAMLFNPLVNYRVLLFLLFWFLAWLSGKKNNPIITITVILCIVLFNLIMPYGRVLYSIGTFKITQGALVMGIFRAVTLGALIMLSRITIRRDLRIPGIFGELIGEAFRIFSIIMNQKHRITRKNLIGDIDNLMIELSRDDSTEAPQAAAVLATKTKPVGFIILAAVVIVAVFPWLSILYEIIVSRF